ncbi:MAG: MerR family transcriptional regulator [Alphaproteobacteria bacterium]|jgi:DNA-binding transcriptional MerR regulator|nr:MerR family transcriptional regulator [Alphaproteobacteria bacterium]
MADGDGHEGDGRRPGKSAAAFRTISEVATELDIPAHVLRFWESKFAQVKPLKRGGGRRYYRPEDIELLRGIRDLLYTDGYTIKGVQKQLREGGVKAVVTGVGKPSAGAALEKTTAPVAQPAPAQPGEIATDSPAFDGAKRAELASVLAELENLRDMLKNASAR